DAKSQLNQNNDEQIGKKVIPQTQARQNDYQPGRNSVHQHHGDKKTDNKGYKTKHGSLDDKRRLHKPTRGTDNSHGVNFFLGSLKSQFYGVKNNQNGDQNQDNGQDQTKGVDRRGNRKYFINGILFLRIVNAVN